MTETSKLLKRHSKRDSIEALYYAVRYLHRPEVFSKNPEAVFVDAEESLPSEAARTLTKRLLRSIEQRAGGPAETFSAPVRKDALDELLSASEQLNLGTTPAAKAAAEKWVARNTAQGPDIAREEIETEHASVAG